MSVSRLLLMGLLSVFSSSLLGKSVVTFQNNTPIDYTITISQSGNVMLQSNQWTLMANGLHAWQASAGIFDFDPDTTMGPGDTVQFNVLVMENSDTMKILVRYVHFSGGVEQSFSASGSGMQHPWHTDSYFHEGQVQLGSGPIVVKYKSDPDSIDLNDDITFAFEESFVYSIDSLDFQDPHVCNIMSYNIKLMPLVSTNFYERGFLFPSHISPYQDVVVYQEVFSDSARSNYLTPAMEAEGFMYRTTILNDTAMSNITSATNGGVIIYSRWPIEFEDEIKYANCSDNSSWDCLSSKGVKYAKVNKLGVPYHVFGTHMEAGGSAADVQYRMEQHGEMRTFIDQQSISQNECVIIAGDLNTSPKDGIEYVSIQDSLDPVIPDHVGYFESTFSYADTGNVIDHIWVSSNHLLPVMANNSVITFRSTDSLMWSIFDFSDHRTVIGRFEFPDIVAGFLSDTVLCEGDDLTLEVLTNTGLGYQWIKDGVPIPGENASFLSIVNANNGVEGSYSCLVVNELVLGNSSHPLSNWFFQAGSVSLEQEYLYDIANVFYENPCGVFVPENIQLGFSIYPSVNNGLFYIELYDPGPIRIEVLDLFGRSVIKKDLFANSKIELPPNNKGLFLVRVRQNGATKTNRIIVH